MLYLIAHPRGAAPVAGCIVLAVATLALAHQSAKGVVKERMYRLKGQQKEMKLIGDGVHGLSPTPASFVGVGAPAHC